MKGSQAWIACLTLLLVFLAGFHPEPRAWAKGPVMLDGVPGAGAAARLVASNEQKHQPSPARSPIVIAPTAQHQHQPGQPTLPMVVTPPGPPAAAGRTPQERGQPQQLPEVPQGSAALPAGVASDWWGQVQKNIRAREYNLRWQERTLQPDLKAAWQAPNRAQNLRTYFTPEGVRVIPRTEATPSWEWGLVLERYGYQNNLHPVPVAELVAEGNRIEYRRGSLTEWYVNDPRGLEQGFTLAVPPEPAQAAEIETVVVQLAVRGNVTPVLSADRQTLEFLSPAGVRVLRYGKLHVVDAGGRALLANLMLNDRTLTIQVQVQGAAYPITIDPLLDRPSWSAESDQASAYFGDSVASAGDVNGDGYSDVIVGAWWYDVSESNEGVAWVYHGSPTGLSTSPDWTARGNQAGAEFGSSVASAGDVNGDGYSDVIVGAPGYEDDQMDEGAAFVYHGSYTGLAAAHAWMVWGNQVGAVFGFSVASAGDVNGDGYSDIIVGTPYYDRVGPPYVFDGGGAWVWQGSPAGIAGALAWAAVSSQAGGAEFGFSVASAGDVNKDGYSDVIVGAPRYDYGETDEGAVFVWHGSGGGLSPPTAPDWFTDSDQANAFFGWSVASAGDVNGDFFSDVIVGAMNYTNGEDSEGAAFVYRGSAGGLNAPAAWRAEGNEAFAFFGSSVASAGNVNGDDYDDVIVGAPRLDGSEIDEGAAIVYYGSKTGLDSTLFSRVWGGQFVAHFGSSVASAGDVDNNGYSDIIVGAPDYDNGETDEGAAFVYYHSVSFIPGDTLFVDQWHLHNTGQGGGKPDADVDAPEAWALEQGSPDIVIAILDTGVETGHEDLVDNIFTNPDEIPGNESDDDYNGYVDDVHGWDFSDNDNGPNPSHEKENHGTAVAGVAAARGDNNLGVSGICPNCRILPIKIGKYLGEGEEAYVEFVANGVKAHAIRYAASLADVLNNSWSEAPSDTVRAAIREATTAGRGGKGSVVVFAAGNNASGYMGQVRLVPDIPAGTHRFRWEYTKDLNDRYDTGDDTAWLAWVRFPGEELVNFEQALPPYWTTGGDAPWTAVEDPTHTDEGACLIYAAKAGSITHNQSSFLEVVKDVPTGDIEFHAWVSSEEGYDGLRLRVDYNNDGTWDLGSDLVSGVPKVGFNVKYPAAYPEAIAVGASSNFDCRSDYSRFGAELDFVAPSGAGPLNLWIVTTDRTGADGYNEYDDYTATFSGTSSAAPLAAGVAGLMLSANPYLTQDLVRQVLRETADKIGPEPYTWGRNDRYGYGRINAFKAVQAVQLPTNGEPPPIDISPLWRGHTDLDHNWQWVFLPGALQDPVVIVGPPSYQETDPGVTRARNVGNMRFEARFQEWDYLDGTHAPEGVPYVMMERGHHTMTDNSLWEAGTFSLDGTGSWSTQSFTQAFPETPKLFLTVQTYHDAQAVAVRARNVTSAGFEAALFEQESLMDGHVAETVGYLAVYSPSGSGMVDIGGKLTSYSLENKVIDHHSTAVDSTSLKVEEEGSQDTEVEHPGETIDILTLGDSLFAQDVSTIGLDTAALRRDDRDTDGDGLPDWLDFDDDNDGMPDTWEEIYGLEPLDPSDAAADPDGDGLTNLAEYQPGTDPTKADTDGDGMPDGWEVTYGLDPLVDDALADADGDGYTNLEEYRSATDPNDPNSHPPGAMPWIPLLLLDD